MARRLQRLGPDELADILDNGPVLVDFYQRTCAPCRALEPRVEAFAARHRDHVRVVQIDIDQHPKAIERFGVQSLPTVILFSDGQETERPDGLIRDEDMEAAVDRAR
jgi:thioredoxin 1